MKTGDLSIPGCILEEAYLLSLFTVSTSPFLILKGSCHVSFELCLEQAVVYLLLLALEVLVDSI